MKTNTETPTAPSTGTPLTQETFRVPGITCGGCIRRVSTLLQRLPLQVDSVSVGQATLSYDVTRIARAQIVEALRKAGYPTT